MSEVGRNATVKCEDCKKKVEVKYTVAVTVGDDTNHVVCIPCYSATYEQQEHEHEQEYECYNCHDMGCYQCTPTSELY